MKLRYFCPKCVEIVGDYNEDSTAEVEYPIIEDGPIESFCPRGHSNTVLPTIFNYEMTLDYAYFAFTKGFYREAVIDAYASLEGAYSQVITTYFLKDLHTGSVPENYEDNIKSTLKLSERRIGAFSVICALNGIRPLLLSDKTVKIRNDCVHNGKNPKRDGAFSFLKEVTLLIVSIRENDAFSNNLDFYRQARIGNDVLRFSLKTPIPIFSQQGLLADERLRHLRSAYGSLDEAIQINNEDFWSDIQFYMQETFE